MARQGREPSLTFDELLTVPLEKREALLRQRRLRGRDIELPNESGEIDPRLRKPPTKPIAKPRSMRGGKR